MANCNYKVHMKDIQNKYKFKIFCTGSGADLTNYYTKNETDTLLSGLETANNKVTSLSSSSTDTQYPSAKTVYDSQVEQNTQISDLKEENDYLQSIINQMPKVTGEGTNITLDNTLEAKLDIQLKGNASQYTTTGKNIFDKSNPIIINGYIRDNQPTVVVNSNNSNRIVAVQCKANTTYTVQKTGGNRFSLITYNSLISENGEYVVTNFVRGTTDGSPEPASQTISTGNDTYLYVHLFDNVNNVNLQEILATIQIEEGSSATTFEEYTGGMPSPNPDYPQEIEVVTGENVVKVEGKNLFNKNSGIDYRKFYTNTGEIGTDNDTFIQTIYISVNSNTRYTISGYYSDYFRICEYDKNKNFIQRDLSDNTTTSFSIITTAQTKYVRISCFNRNLSSLQFEQGSTATPYEAYKGQNYPINLGSLEMCKIGDYEDYFYKNNNKWYKKEIIKKLIFNGSEDWVLDDRYMNISQFSVSAQGLYINDSTTLTAISTHFKGVPFNQSWFKDNAITTIISGKIRIMMSSITSVDDFKNWLSQNNTTTYFIPINLEEVEITDTTLVSQLNELEKALAYQNQTNISQTNADKPFIIDASTIYDLSNLVTRVAVLETE